MFPNIFTLFIASSVVFVNVISYFMISLEYTFAPCFNSVLPKRAFVLTSIPLTVFISPVILLSANIDVVVISDGLTSFISFSQDISTKNSKIKMTCSGALDSSKIQSCEKEIKHLLKL